MPACVCVWVCEAHTYKHTHTHEQTGRQQKEKAGKAAIQMRGKKREKWSRVEKEERNSGSGDKRKKLQER